MTDERCWDTNAAIVVALWTLGNCLPATSLEIDVTYGDSSPIPGFNDPVLGPERQAAFQKAIDIWETHLQGNITVKVDARFVNFAAPAPLGAGMATSASANLPGLPLDFTWYHSALASQLTGTSLPASGGPFVGFHMIVAVEDSLNTGPVGSGIWYYGLDGNPPGSDIDFVSVVLHELGHCLGFAPLININTGEWANVLIGQDPPPVLPFGDICSRQLTRTPNPVGGPNDIDFWDMTNAQRLAAVTSDEVYWLGFAVKSAAEFTPPPPMGFPQINSKDEVQMFAPSPMNRSALAHWDDNHVNDVLMAPFATTPFQDIDATKEAMVDIGWGVNTPSASGPVAWVDFDFAGEEFGTEVLPFNTLAEADAFVTASGTVNVKAGTTSETITISKAMTVNAVGGTVTIGAAPKKAHDRQNKTGFISTQPR